MIVRSPGSGEPPGRALGCSKIGTVWHMLLHSRTNSHREASGGCPGCPASGSVPAGQRAPPATALVLVHCGWLARVCLLINEEAFWRVISVADGDALGLRMLRQRHDQREDAAVEARVHLVAVNVLTERDRAGNLTRPELAQQPGRRLEMLLWHRFGRAGFDHEDVLAHGEVNVLWLDAGEQSLNEEMSIGLENVHLADHAAERARPQDGLLEELAHGVA